MEICMKINILWKFAHAMYLIYSILFYFIKKKIYIVFLIPNWITTHSLKTTGVELF